MNTFFFLGRSDLVDKVANLYYKNFNSNEFIFWGKVFFAIDDFLLIFTMIEREFIWFWNSSSRIESAAKMLSPSTVSQYDDDDENKRRRLKVGLSQRQYRESSNWVRVWDTKKKNHKKEIGVSIDRTCAYKGDDEIFLLCPIRFCRGIKKTLHNRQV